MLLEAQAITKAFAGVQALRRVSFDLRPGEVHALVGENGAGKSTLIKIMTGAVQPDAGTLTVNGRPVPHMTPATGALARHRRDLPAAGALPRSDRRGEHCARARKRGWMGPHRLARAAAAAPPLCCSASGPPSIPIGRANR